MIFRRKAAPLPVDPWEEEGRRLAPLFASVASAVVVGADPDAAARVAVGLARASSVERRVAIADLSGASPVLSTLAGTGGGPGITDSFLDGVSLNDVARPAADGTPSLFILPCGGDATVPASVLASDRWTRLAAGFAEAGALLLLVAPTNAPGLDALVPQTDGALAVGDAALPLEWRVLAQAYDRTPPSSGDAGRTRARRSWERRHTMAAALIVVIAAAAVLLPPRVASPPGLATPRPKPVPAVKTPASPVIPADTVTVSAPVNPSDSTIAAEFAVELVATNTVSGANSWVRERGVQLPGVTISPVLLGGGRERWYQVLAGAWRDRTRADSMLAALRAEGVLRAERGLVVRTPVALLLEAGVARDAAPARVAGYVARGVPAYALLQDDGSVRLYAGAFETAAAAVLLGADLRAAGLATQVAYRTGRTF